MRSGKVWLVAAGLLAAAAAAHPPDAPLTDYGPAKMAAGFTFDHSGQDLFSRPAASLLNTFAAQITYAPAGFVHVGLYLGGAEFDHDPVSDTGHGFNSGVTPTCGASAKVYSPAFSGGLLHLFLQGSAGYLKADDGYGNIRRLQEYHAGGGVLLHANAAVSLGLGGEYYGLVGDQQSPGVAAGNNPFGNSDPYRLLAVVEYYPPMNRDLSRLQPFISVAVRPSFAAGWNDRLGLENASVSASFGFVTDYLYGEWKARAAEE